MLLVVAFWNVQLPPALGQVGKLLPVDEAAKDPELFAFRTQLQAAVARHDAAALLDFVDPYVRPSEEVSGVGRDWFRSYWLAPEREKKLWEELGLVLALGGVFQGDDSFTAPYVARLLPGTFDQTEYAVIIGAKVNVRAKPEMGSPVLTTLSFDIVKAPSDQEVGYESEWVAVQLQDGRMGYVSSRYIRRSAWNHGYYVLFSRTKGRWWLTTFSSSPC